MVEMSLSWRWLLFALPPDKQEITSLGEDAKVKKLPDDLLVLLRVIEGAEPGKGYQINEMPITIGRDKICKIMVNDSKMSRQHAGIYYYSPDFFIKDLASTNGTLVNDKPVKQARLRSGDRIKLGGTVFEFIVSKMSGAK